MGTWHAIWSKRRPIGFALILATPIFTVFPSEHSWMCDNGNYIAFCLIILGWILIFSALRKPRSDQSETPALGACGRGLDLYPRSRRAWRRIYVYAVWQTVCALTYVHVLAVATLFWQDEIIALNDSQVWTSSNMVVLLAAVLGYLIIFAEWTGVLVRAVAREVGGSSRPGAPLNIN